ncbi:MAG: endonuclease III [Tepidisphaeraceae bacterium]|jgi:endonuclease-3
MVKASAIGQRHERVMAILPILKRTYPKAACTLDHKTPLQLLVATILSAQCTDVRVNLVTPGLFRKYKTAADYAEAPAAELERDIQSTGFYHNKAKSIQTMAASLVSKHGGRVPDTMEELTSLAGVGRKTANVVLGNAFGKNVGVVVDTHVARLSQRLGLSSHAAAEKIERDLMEIVPQDQWTLWSHLLIHHGRAVCTARQPLCEKCPIFDHCPMGEKILAERRRGQKAKAP